MGLTKTYGQYTIAPTDRTSLVLPLLSLALNPYVMRRWQAIMTRSLTRPFMLFFNEPILQVFGVYMAFVYGVFYCKPLSYIHC